MKKVIIASIIVFFICLGVNLFSKAYNEEFITFEYENKKIVYNLQTTEETKTKYTKKVKIRTNEEVSLENVNTIKIKLIRKDKEKYVIKIEGQILQTEELEKCKNHENNYILEYNKEYSINYDGNTYIDFKAKI